MKPIDQSSIRKQNLCRLWNILSIHPGITRPELSKQTNLSQMTIGNLVDLLEKNAVVQVVSSKETHKGKRHTGRIADCIQINHSLHAILMIDLTDRHFRFSSHSIDLKCLFSGEPFCYNPQDTYTENLRRFLSSVQQSASSRLDGREIIGIVVIVPGPYNASSDTVNNKRVPEINGLKIKELMYEYFDDCICYVDEDVKLAVRAYMNSLDPIEDKMLYLLYISEGVGGAAMHNDRVLRGLNAVLGDAGQLCLTSGKTYEEVISLRAFARSLDIESCEQFGSYTLLEKIYAIAQSEPDKYRYALTRIAIVIAQMLNSLVWILDPTEIVIDCRYAAKAPDLFIDTIASELTFLVGNGLPCLPRCNMCTYEPSNVVVGAVQVIISHWFEKIMA